MTPWPECRYVCTLPAHMNTHACTGSSDVCLGSLRQGQVWGEQKAVPTWFEGRARPGQIPSGHV
jgi:hypothetical protein